MITAVEKAERDLRLAQKDARRAREKRRSIVSKRPEGYVELYIPPESRKATRVGVRPRDDVAPNVPNTAKWLLDGMVGLSPADSSMLWHVQGVPAVYTAQQMEEYHSNAARLSKRVKAERHTPKGTQKAPKVPVVSVARRPSDGGLVKLVRSAASQESETEISNPGDDEPSSPSEPPLGGRTLTFSGKNKAKRPPSGRKARTDKLAYSNVYMPLAMGMNIAPRQRGSLRMSARSGEAARPATAPAAAGSARARAPVARAEPARPATARSISQTSSPGHAAVAEGDAEVMDGATVSQYAETVFERLDSGGASADASAEQSPAVTPPNSIGGAGGVWPSRPSTAPQRVDGAVLRERMKQSATGARPGSAMREPDSVKTRSRPSSGGSRVEMMVLASGQREPPKTPIRYVDVSNGQPMTSIITAPVGDSSSPISPNTRLRRAQAAAPHYFSDHQGRTRHIAVDMSTRIPGGKDARAEQARARGGKGRRQYLKVSSRPLTARSHSSTPSPPAKAGSQTARPSTAGSHRRVSQTTAVSVTPVLAQGTATVEWQMGASPPAWSRHGKTGWGGRGGSAGVIRTPVVRMSKMQAKGIASGRAAPAAAGRKY